MNHPVTSMLVIGNASLETAGKYICFARFDSVIVEQDIYVAINCKPKRKCKLCCMYDVSQSQVENEHYSLGIPTIMLDSSGSSFGTDMQESISCKKHKN